MGNNRFEKISFYFLLGALFFTPIDASISIPLMIFSLVFFLLTKKGFTINLLDKLQLGLLGSVILSSIFAVNKLHSFYTGSAFVVYLLAYFLAKGLLNTDARLKMAARTIGFLVLTISMIGIFQFFTQCSFSIMDILVVVPMNSGAKITSSCYNSVILASFLGFTIPILVSFAIKGEDRMFFVSASILGIIAFLLTQSRGATVALVGGLFFLFLILEKRVVSFLVAGVLIGIVLLIGPLRMRFAQIFYCSNDVSRIIAYHSGIRMWLDNSILTGVGIHNFYLLFEKYALPGHSGGSLYIHFMFLNFLVDAGVVGFLALLAVFSTVIEWIRKTYKESMKENYVKWMNAGLMGSFIGLLIHNFVDNTIYVLGLGILFWMCMGIVSGIDRTLPSKNIKD